MKIYEYTVHKEFVAGALEGKTINHYAEGYLIDYEDTDKTPDQQMEELFPETEEAVFLYTLHVTNNIQLK